MERKLPGKFFRKFGYTSRKLSSFLEISENSHYRCSQPKNAVPFSFPGSLLFGETLGTRLWQRGAFHSTKTFENFETEANGTEISWKSFQKFRKLLNFRNANHSTEPFEPFKWKLPEIQTGSFG